MTDKPNLSLPPRQEWAPPAPRRPGGLALLVGLGVAAILAIEVYGLLVQMSAPAGGESGRGGAAVSSRRSSVPLREVAARLQRDNLHSAAAEAYEEYLATADLPDPERGNILLEVGNLLAKAGKYEDALGRYVRASHLAPEANQPVLRRQIQECLQRLGKHAEGGYELSDSLSARSQAGKDAAKTVGDEKAGRVVAWIGPEKLTASDLDHWIAEEIEEGAASVPGMPPERLAEMKSQAQKRFSSPQARLAKLQEILARRVLYFEGLEKGLDKSARAQKRVEDFRRDAVVEEMVYSALDERIKISEADLRNYHKAHPERYRSKASAKVRIAVLPDEAKAKEALAAAGSEDDFAKMAGESSLETVTKPQGGLLEQPVVEGEPLPVIGPTIGSAPELAQAILAAEPGKTIAAPVRVASGFAVAFVREKMAPKPLPFEEVRDRAGRDYAQEKQVEVQQALVKELFEKHRVSIATEAFLPGSAADQAESEKKSRNK